MLRIFRLHVVSRSLRSSSVQVSIFSLVILATVGVWCISHVIISIAFICPIVLAVAGSSFLVLFIAPDKGIPPLVGNRSLGMGVFLFLLLFMWGCLWFIPYFVLSVIELHASHTFIGIVGEIIAISTLLQWTLLHIMSGFGAFRTLPPFAIAHLLGRYPSSSYIRDLISSLVSI